MTGNEKRKDQLAARSAARDRAAPGFVEGDRGARSRLPGSRAGARRRPATAALSGGRGGDCCSGGRRLDWAGCVAGSGGAVQRAGALRTIGRVDEPGHSMPRM